MDYIKLVGIIEAIEGEQKLPNPSHSNLARLTAMALRAMIESDPKVVSEDPKPLYDTLHTDETKKPKRSKKNSK